jgi:hypothetical protein
VRLTRVACRASAGPTWTERPTTSPTPTPARRRARPPSPRASSPRRARLVPRRAVPPEKSGAAGARLPRPRACGR